MTRPTSLWLEPPHRTPTPPNLPRPWRKLFAITAFMLAVGGVAAWGRPYVFAAITSYVEVSVI